ncbi:MAG: hypothetical protein WCK51_10515 [Armatimonadota bacterium]
MKNARRTIAFATMAIPLTTVGQVVAPLTFNEKANVSNSTSEIGGTPAVDIIRLDSGGLGAPLRFGSVLKGTEVVTLNGVRLRPGADYSFDYSVGVVYVSRAVREGDSLSVSYRYDGKKKVDSGSSAMGVAPMKFNLLGNSMPLRLGLGQLERTADGKVLRTNIYGTKNSFTGGGLGLSGAYFAGSRSEEGVGAGFSFDGAKGGNLSSETGKSSFLVQSFRSSLAGGSLTADLQDVSKNFTGFNAVKDSGYSEQQVAAFARERGLKRTGFGAEALKFGSLNFSGSQKLVKDEDKGISVSSYAVGTGGFSYSQNKENVERGFNRFKDLGVADWQRLQVSQGINKTAETAGFKSKFLSLGYESSRVQDFERDKGIQKQKVILDSKNWALELGSQSVDAGFNRFEAERGAFGLEAGLKRQSAALTKGVIGKGLNLTFSKSSVDNGVGTFDASDIAISGKTWALNMGSRGSDKGFNRLGSMQPGEIDSHMRAVAGMYGPNAAVQPADRQAFIGSAGIQRDGANFKSNIKGGTLNVNQVKIAGEKGGAAIHTANIAGKNLQFSMRKLNTGTAFNEISRLMPYEQQQIGLISGISRTDLNLAMQMSKGQTFSYSSMAADVNGTGAGRTNLAYRGQGLEVDYNQRRVDTGFSVMGLVDSQRDLMNSLTGFSQKDSRIKFSALKNIQFEYSASSAYRDTNEELRASDALMFSMALDPTLQVDYAKASQLNKQSTSTLFAANMERVSLNKRFGNQNLSITNEKIQNDGSNNGAPDSNRTTVAVETKLSGSTSFRTEQSRTAFNDGGKEDVNSNSISTKIAKNVGVSVTDTNIDRGSSDRNEVKRDYGVWFDFGKGVRASYGHVRHLNGDAAGFGSSSLSFGQDANRIAANQAIGGVGGANVNGTTLGFQNGTNTWDEQNGRAQAFSSATLQTTKPFSLGFLKESKFSLNSYMASDNSRWLREDIMSSFESKIGKYGVGMNYRGQVDQTGSRAIDRTYKLNTDTTGKAPLAASMSYKQRVLPTNQEFAIRDYKVDYKGIKGFTLSNQIQTNPEGPVNPNIVLGTQPLAQRRNTWRMDYTANKDFTLGGQFDELIDDAVRSIRRTAGFNLTLNQRSGSPISFFYGMEQSDLAGNRQDYVRFGLTFEQKASANQVFSLALTNQGWLNNANASLANQNDWVGRLNYQWRFK